MAAKRTASQRSAPKSAETGATSGERSHRGGTSAWEWAAAGLGAAILAGVIGYLIYEHFSRPERAYPEIVARSGAIERLKHGAYLVPVVVVNRGHLTGAGVTVKGELVDAAGNVVEDSVIMFDFVAPHSKAGGGLYFTADPGAYRLELRVEGYTDPWPRPADVIE